MHVGDSAPIFQEGLSAASRTVVEAIAHRMIWSENFTAPDAAFETAGNISWIGSVHGFEGPVQNTYPNYFFPGSGKNTEAAMRLSNACRMRIRYHVGNWWTAAEYTGVTSCPDPNAGDVKGIY